MLCTEGLSRTNVAVRIISIVGILNLRDPFPPSKRRSRMKLTPQEVYNLLVLEDKILELQGQIRFFLGDIDIIVKQKTMETVNIHHSFKPIINESSKTLILGTLPGPESLQKGQYYANPYNQFWRIIYSVFGEIEIDPSYSGKLSFLRENDIALWDIFYSAQRKGALDADIKNEIPNDISGLIELYPCINRILLNGRRAERSFRMLFSKTNIDAVYVPSTSTAFAKKSLDEKIKDWKYAIIS